VKPADLAAWVAPKRPLWQAAIEVPIFVLLIVAAGIWFEPEAWFSARADVPWVWIALIVPALRYGSAAAAGAMVLAAAAWFAFARFHPDVALDFAGRYFLGVSAVALICGEFCDIWVARLRRVTEVNLYLSEKFEHLTRRHYLLKLSHDQLEQELVEKPKTLRESLLELRTLMIQPAGAKSVLPAAAGLMQMLGKACRMEVASLYPCKQEQPVPSAAALLGLPQPLDTTDALLHYALESKALAHVQTEELQETRSPYLIAAPVLTSAKQMIAVLTVERMPFLALNSETLQLLTVILGYYADLVQTSPEAALITAQLPGCPLDFAAEIMRLDRLYRTVGLESRLVALVCQKGPDQDRLYMEALRRVRQGDSYWQTENDHGKILVTLMPLAGYANVEGYRIRTEVWLRQLLGESVLEPTGLRLHEAQIGGTPPIVVLSDLMARCR